LLHTKAGRNPMLPEKELTLILAFCSGQMKKCLKRCFKWPQMLQICNSFSSAASCPGLDRGLENNVGEELSQLSGHTAGSLLQTQFQSVEHVV